MKLSILLCAAVILAGCSGGVATTAPVQISQSDLKSSAIFRAKSALDNIERLPAAQRQYAADSPKTMEALYTVSQSDPATKKRIEDLGIAVKAPTQPKTRG